MKSFSPTIGRMFLVAVASLFAATVMGVEYVWTGAAGDGKWITPGNWDVKVDDGSGEIIWEAATTYPGQKQSDVAYDYDPSTVSFTNSVELVDLSDANGGQGIYYFSNNEPILFENKPTIKFYNGKFANLTSIETDRFRIGGDGVTLIFEKFSFKPIRTVSSSVISDQKAFKVVANVGTTMIFEGTNSSSEWRLEVEKYRKVSLVVRNGTLNTKNTTGSPSYLTVSVSNAVWTMVGATAGIAGEVHIEDLPDEVSRGESNFRESQLDCGKNSYMTLSGTFNIKLRADGRINPFISAKGHQSGANYFDDKVTFKIDVTKWNKGGAESKIPLVKFTQAPTEDMINIKLASTTLVAIANGRDVTKRRNARLEWDSSKNTLYYVQDKPSDGMKVIVR